MTPGPPSPDPAPSLRRLLPDADPTRSPSTRVAVGQLIGDLDLGAHVPVHRPYTVVNFVASADGHAAFRGRSRWLSDDADREMFHGLREKVDAVMAGTGTLRS